MDVRIETFLFIWYFSLPHHPSDIFVQKLKLIMSSESKISTRNSRFKKIWFLLCLLVFKPIGRSYHLVWVSLWDCAGRCKYTITISSIFIGCFSLNMQIYMTYLCFKNTLFKDGKISISFLLEEHFRRFNLQTTIHVAWNIVHRVLADCFTNCHKYNTLISDITKTLYNKLIKI